MKSLPLFRIINGTSKTFYTGAEMPLQEAITLFNKELSSFKEDHFEEINYVIIYCYKGEVRKYNGKYKFGYDYLSFFDSIICNEKKNYEFYLSNETLWKRKYGKENFEKEIMATCFNKDNLPNHLKQEMRKQSIFTNYVS